MILRNAQGRCHSRSKSKVLPGARSVSMLIAITSLATACNAAGPAASTSDLSAQQLVDLAVSGQTISIPASAKGDIRIYDKKFPEPVTIDMSHANVSAVIVRRSRNLKILNGRVTGNNTRGSFGIIIENSQEIEVSNVTVTQAQAGIWIRTSQDVLVSGNHVTDLISDGIMLTSSQRVKVYNNTCSNFHPLPKTFDEQGNQIEDGDHPDCIQGWSVPDYAPMSDLEVVGNRGDGDFQGVFLNNPMAGGRGYDRVTVTDNVMRIGWYHGVYLEDVRGGLVTRNSIRPNGRRDIRGKVFDRPVRPYITILTSTNIKACGNVVTEFPTGEGTKRC